MQKKLFRFPMVLLALVTVAAGAETVDEYATLCSQELSFKPSDIPANLNCNDGVPFVGLKPSGSARLDYVGYKRISAYNDLVFACRWMNNGPLVVTDTAHPKTPPFQAASSIEMIIHNRSTGKTCFFAAKPGLMTINGTPFSARVSTAIVSPYAANTSGSSPPYAYNYWMRPDEIESDTQFPSSSPGSLAALRCVGCHIAGPYVASLDIAPSLAQYGLLNDGHDTGAPKLPSAPNSHYTVVGSNPAFDYTPSAKGFKTWNTLVSQFNNPNACSTSCHALGNNTMIPAALDIFLFDERNANEPLIPSLATNITAISNANAMPPTDNASAYRWMNVDIPDDANTTGDVEVYYPLKAGTLGFGTTLNQALTCETEPAYMEARVVGSPVTYKTNEFTTANVSFPDKLEEFDQNGLICRNSSQPSGMCSNYAVRFICFNYALSVYSHWTNRVLTIANPDANQVRWAKGQPSTPAWYGSQTWHIESVNDGVHYNYVRFRNDWLGAYLNADGSTLKSDGSSDLASIASFRDTWLSEQWAMEYVPGTHYVRFKNLWQTGLYLTIADGSDYSSIYLLPLHKDRFGTPDWISQEWELK